MLQIHSRHLAAFSLLVSSWLWLSIATATEPSFAELERNAHAGDVESLFRLGQAYGDGTYRREDVEVDLLRSFTYHKRAAEAGHAISASILGTLYHNGRGGIEKDMDAAVLWWEKAAALDNVSAHESLVQHYMRNGAGYKPDVERANAWSRKLVALRMKAAKTGDPAAQYALGRYYSYALHGVEPSAEKSIEWYRKSGEGGFLDAQTRLGEYYANGTMVAPDIHEALRWLDMAAEQGDQRSRGNARQLRAFLQKQAQQAEVDAQKARISAQRAQQQAQKKRMQELTSGRAEQAK